MKKTHLSFDPTYETLDDLKSAKYTTHQRVLNYCIFALTTMGIDIDEIEAMFSEIERDSSEAESIVTTFRNRVEDLLITRWGIDLLDWIDLVSSLVPFTPPTLDENHQRVRGFGCYNDNMQFTILLGRPIQESEHQEPHSKKPHRK